MKTKFLKKIIATAVTGAVIVASTFPMSVSAYAGTYVNSKTTTQTTDMGYQTLSNLVVYTKEIYGKTVVTSGYPTFTYVRTWGSYKVGNTVKTKALIEDYASGAIHAQYVDSSMTFTGGASYHFISSEDDTNTSIKIGNFPKSYTLKVSDQFAEDFYE